MYTRVGPAQNLSSFPTFLFSIVSLIGFKKDFLHCEIKKLFVKSVLRCASPKNDF
jgi:hypothetical protein